jgi:hypothetical protein
MVMMSSRTWQEQQWESVVTGVSTRAIALAISLDCASSCRVADAVGLSDEEMSLSTTIGSSIMV